MTDGEMKRKINKIEDDPQHLREALECEARRGCSMVRIETQINLREGGTNVIVTASCKGSGMEEAVAAIVVEPVLAHLDALIAILIDRVRDMKEADNWRSETK